MFYCDVISALSLCDINSELQATFSDDTTWLRLTVATFSRRHWA